MERIVVKVCEELGFVDVTGLLRENFNTTETYIPDLLDSV